MASFSSAKALKIDVISDFACPWCYVGKARMEAAIAQLRENNEDASVEVRWHPYQIDAATQPDGEEYLSYNRRRWGGDGWTHSLRRAGRQSGLGFASWVTWPNTLHAHTSWATWPNTLHAHRLMQLVQDLEDDGQGSSDLQGKIKDGIFKCIYEEGGNASTIEQLIQIATSCGMDAEVVRTALETDDGLTSSVKQRDRYAKTELDVSGVPFFIIQKGGNEEGGSGGRQTALSGAAGTDEFLSAFSKYL
eukprot:CAMPEP_0194602442 /NCGR_PEP_ID=MMETSP0292-20121207/29656_1 /TAXON_ID=39354 /ORGANISM="Heterosigma akashiwo, Strain CCMP2393" /LENGTH=247 /DNA_ID=CAMNT_0039464693 /DNA_START=81 /DNA_END=824 /DNA_ORIENTATION=+